MPLTCGDVIAGLRKRGEGVGKNRSATKRGRGKKEMYPGQPTSE